MVGGYGARAKGSLLVVVEGAVLSNQGYLVNVCCPCSSNLHSAAQVLFGAAMSSFRAFRRRLIFYAHWYAA